MNFQAQYNISVNPVGLTGAAASNYTRKVNEHLSWINRTVSGRILLASIKYHGKPVVIQPYTGADCNATGGWHTVGGAVQGIIRYSPHTFSLHGACSATKSARNRGLYWDEILFHELVHVFRGVSGKFVKRPVFGGLTRYDDSEEFVAVLLTNIYISDRSNKIKSGLRADHQGFHPLEPQLAQPWGFFSSGTQTFNLIKTFVTDNPGISRRIATDLAKAPFNPIAEYFTDKAKAERLSKQALPRDVGAIIAAMVKSLGL
jgi:NleD-like pathogen effector protein (putative zinc metallopeptidase)